MTRNPNLQRGVVGAILRNDRWLMIQRSDHVIAPRKWCFPGGGVEEGESNADAVVRELQEELSLVVKPVRPIWSWTREDKRLHLEWWEARIIDGTPTPNPAEVRDFGWMTTREIRALPDVLENLLPFLDFHEANGSAQ